MKTILIKLAIKILQKYKIIKITELKQGFYNEKRYYKLEINKNIVRV